MIGNELICVGALPRLGCPSCMMGLDQIPYTNGDFAELNQASTTFESLFALAEDRMVRAVMLTLQLLRPVGAVVAGIHGYRRNDSSWGAALGWGALGFIFPVITPVVALAQGYGKAKDLSGFNGVHGRTLEELRYRERQLREKIKEALAQVDFWEARIAEQENVRRESQSYAYGWWNAPRSYETEKEAINSAYRKLDAAERELDALWG